MQDVYTSKRYGSNENADSGARANVQHSGPIPDVPISPKTLTPEEQARVRDALDHLCQGKTQQAVADALRVKQQTVSAVRRGGSVGVKVAHAVAKELGISPEELLTGTRRKRFADLEGWAKAASLVVGQDQVPRHAVEVVSMWPAVLSGPATMPMVRDLARLWLDHATLEEKAAAATEEAARDFQRHG